MTDILRELPYEPGAYRLKDALTSIEDFEIRQNQIVCWASLTRDNYEWNDSVDIPRFPVVIDTGNGRNFNIQEAHLIDWAKAGDLDEVEVATPVRINGVVATLKSATLWLYRNIPGELTPDRSQPPFPIDFSPGIEVLPSSGVFPRLPLLGMRALYIARLELTINGFTRTVSLRQLSMRIAS